MFVIISAESRCVPARSNWSCPRFPPGEEDATARAGSPHPDDGECRIVAVRRTIGTAPSTSRCAPAGTCRPSAVRTSSGPCARRSQGHQSEASDSSTSACSTITSICSWKRTASLHFAAASRDSPFASRRQSIGRSRRRGRVWVDRHHARALATPREVRHAIVYVLQNFRKHLRGVRGLDPKSSAAWFTGWRKAITMPSGRSPVVAARTWLAAVGWRRHGLIGMDEAPRRGSPR
jgi:hypothetical protein